MEKLFAECIEKNKLSQLLLQQSAPKSKIYIFGGCIRDFIHQVGVEKRDPKIIRCAEYATEDKIIDRKRNDTDTVIVKDIDFVTDDLNLKFHLKEVMEENEHLHMNAKEESGYAGLKIRGMKDHFKAALYERKYGGDIADICIITEIGSLPSDMNINRIAFDLKEKRFLYIGGTESDLKTAIEDIMENRFELCINLQIADEMFISRGYALFRISKMWMKGYRPKDKEAFRKLYQSVQCEEGSRWQFPSTQFSKPIARAKGEIEEFLK